MRLRNLRRWIFRTCPQPCDHPVCLEEHPAADSYPKNCYLPLTMVSPGESVRLIRIIAGYSLRRRLTELGLIPGVEFKIMQDEGGPLLLAVKDTRLALGRGMAHRIIVEAV